MRRYSRLARLPPRRRSLCRGPSAGRGGRCRRGRALVTERIADHVLRINGRRDEDKGQERERFEHGWRPETLSRFGSLAATGELRLSYPRNRDRGATSLCRLSSRTRGEAATTGANFSGEKRTWGEPRSRTPVPVGWSDGRRGSLRGGGRGWTPAARGMRAGRPASQRDRSAGGRCCTAVTSRRRGAGAGKRPSGPGALRLMCVCG